MGGNAKNLFMVVGFLVALVLLVFGLNELRGVLVGAEDKLAPTAVNTTGITGNSAIVNFATAKPVFSRIIYGSDPQQLSLFSVETDQTDTHGVTLSFLSPNTTYYYKVRAYTLTGKIYRYSEDSNFASATTASPTPRR